MSAAYMLSLREHRQLTPDTGQECSGYDLASGRPCDLLTIRSAVAGCVHEHIGRRPLCASHLDDLERGTMHCGSCAEVGCECLLAAVPLLGEQQP